MKIRTLGCYLPLAALLAGCAAPAPNPGADGGEQVTTFTREEKQGSVVIHSSMGSPDIKNWRVVDNKTLIIETYRHGELLATFSSPCSGIRFADSLGFSTLGPFELDKSSTVILPDGRRCFIRELEPYVKMEAGEE